MEKRSRNIPRDETAPGDASNASSIPGEYVNDSQSLDSASDVAHEPTDETEDYERTRGKAMSVAQLHAAPGLGHQDSAVSTSKETGQIGEYWQKLLDYDNSTPLSKDEYDFWGSLAECPPEEIATRIEKYVKDSETNDPYGHLPCV